MSDISTEKRNAATDNQVPRAALGVETVKEIIAGVLDVEEARARGRKLFASVPEAASNLRERADGPPMRLVEAGRNAIQTLVLRVASLERAATFLTEKKMLGSISEDHLTIAPEKICGLDVRLVGDQ